MHLHVVLCGGGSSRHEACSWVGVGMSWSGLPVTLVRAIARRAGDITSHFGVERHPFLATKEIRQARLGLALALGVARRFGLHWIVRG